MMKNIITERQAAGDGQALAILLRKRLAAMLIHAIVYSVLLMCFLSVSFNLSAQTVPILTFDEFEKYLKPENDSIYVINFWATWCMPCIEELPAFEKLNETYKDQKVKVMLVSLDFKSQYEKKVMPFVKRNKLSSEVILLDTQGNNDFIDRVNPQWQGTIPATAIIRSSSKTNHFFEKKFTYVELENIIKPLIENKL